MRGFIFKSLFLDITFVKRSIGKLLNNKAFIFFQNKNYNNQTGGKYEL